MSAAAAGAEKEGPPRFIPSHDGDGPEKLSLRFSKTAAGLIAARPCLACGSCCGLIWLLVVVSALGQMLGFSEDSAKDWDIMSDENVEFRDAIDLAEQDVDCLETPCPEVLPRSLRNSNVITLGVHLMYKTLSGASVLTPANLKSICEIERLFIGSDEYLQHCHLREDVPRNGTFSFVDCTPQRMSVVQLFYANASLDPTECTLIQAATVETRANALYQSLNDPILAAQFGFYVGSDVRGDGGNWTGAQTRYTQSVMGLGYPLAGRDDTEADLLKREVATLYGKGFFDPLEKSFLDFFGLKGNPFRSAYWEVWQHGDIDLCLQGRGYFRNELLRTVNFDMLFCMFSIAFVWAYLTFHTRSFFVASVSLWQIVMTMPLSLIVYVGVFRITYFRQLHGLLIFIILGIGADDVFVFSDAWRQSDDATRVRRQAEAWDPPRVVAEKVAIAYRHTLLTVFNTSATTAMAFGATALSPIMPIQSMGIYAAVLVFMNYLLAITLTPCVFAVRETYLAGRCKSCGGGPRPSLERVSPEVEPDASSMQEVVPIQTKTVPLALSRGLVPLFRNRCVAGTSVVVLTSWGLANFICAVQLPAPTEAFTFFEDEHMTMRAQTMSRNSFALGSDQMYNTITFAFGVSGIDRETSPGMDKWRPQEWYGVPVYDSGFDLSTAAAQQFLRDFCSELRSERCREEGCQPSGMLILQGEESISCFIEQFHTWEQDNYGNASEGSAFIERLSAFRRTSSPNKLDGGNFAKTIGFVGGALKFVQVRAKLSLMTFQGQLVKEPILARVNSFIASEGLRARVAGGPGMTIIQAVPIDWAWMATTRGLRHGLLQGLSVCFPLCFLILLAATGNYIIAFLAVSTVALIVSNVLGYAYMAGWSLGPSECVAGIIVIGLAVDYAIHLGHMYLEAEHHGWNTRQERWEYAIATMGSTVVAGAMTTLFAGLVMQFCQIMFFNQMSTLMVLTIVYSIVYALCGFMALLYLIGPEGKTGDVAHTWSAIVRCARGVASATDKNSRATLS